MSDMTLAQIKADMKRKLNIAMQRTKKDGEYILDESILQYYAGGEPVRWGYKRTGTLINSLYTSESSTDTYASLTLGYDGSQMSYKTGKFSGDQVLSATMAGTYGVVGDPSYDEEAFEKIIEAADKNFKTVFGS